MVIYSNKLATGSELESAYTEPGYVEAFVSPQESANQMIESGVNVESVDKLRISNEKSIVTSPILKKKRFLKRLFLQYIRKYITNPGKYIDHWKQIKNLPSWFDDAIVLFTDDELSRDQKRMIRAFFYGLVQYRDNKVASGNIGPDTEETNRQLGERSPYADYSEGDPDSVVLPYQKEMQNLNVMDIAKNIAAQSDKEQRQPTMEEYVMSDGTDMTINDAALSTQNNSTNMGGVQMGRISSGFSLDNYIRPFGSKPATAPIIQPVTQPVAQPVAQSQGQLRPSAPQQSYRPTAIPVGRMNIDLTSFIMGGKNKPTIFPSVPQPTNEPQSAPLYRKQNKKVSPKINRWAPKLGGVIPKGIILGKISIKSKPSKIKSTKLNNLKKMDFSNISKGITLESVMGKSKTSKKKTGLGNMSDMNKIFANIKVHAKDNYNPNKMKMKIVTDIKDQCGNAFKTNKFKTESLNIKKNFMKEMKESMPIMRMEMNSMGDIHEKNTLGDSMRGIPGMLQVEASSPFMVKRGSMRPKSIGITEYDFDLGNIYKKKRRMPSEEEIYYEE